MSGYIKSPLNYTGGKYKMLDQVYSVIPNNIGTFVDLFAGGFNVGINSKAEHIWCNDQITYLIELYKYFQEHTVKGVIDYIEGRISEYSLTKQDEDGYNRLRSDYNNGNGNILDLFVLTCYSFNHQIRFNGSHKFNTSFGRDRSSYNKIINKNLVDFIEEIHSKDILFMSKDFRQVELDGLGKNDFVYLDPPYLISTGTYNDGKRCFGDWGEQEEKDLINLMDDLNHRDIKFALSNVMYHKGMKNSILIDWADKYNIHYINKEYSNCSYHLKDRDSLTVEVIITNY